MTKVLLTLLMLVLFAGAALADTLHQPCATVGAVPDNDPTIVEQGSAFGLTGTVANPGPDPLWTDVWIMLDVPGVGLFGPILTLIDIPLRAGDFFTDHTLLPIPMIAPPGDYRYIAYCGDYGTNTYCDTSEFTFTVTEYTGGGPYNIGLVTADVNNAWILVSDLLLTSPDIATTGWFNAQPATPALGDLLTYDAVIVWSNGHYQSPSGLGDVLADYVEAGGGVVTTQFSHSTGWAIEGRYATQYAPLGAGVLQGGPQNLVVDDPNHPIMAGVAVGTGSYCNNVVPQGNSYMVQHWDNGYDGTLVNADAPQCVAINAYFGQGDWTGDVGQMIINSVVYTASNALGIWAMIPSEELIAYAPMFNNSLDQTARTGNSSMSATDLLSQLGDNTAAPIGFASLNTHPNPFNAQTSIAFDLAEAGNVNLTVYNLLGEKVVTLIDRQMEAGQHSLTWDAADFSSGVYFAKLKSGDVSTVKKMNLVK